MVSPPMLEHVHESKTSAQIYIYISHFTHAWWSSDVLASSMDVPPLKPLQPHSSPIPSYLQVEIGFKKLLEANTTSCFLDKAFRLLLATLSSKSTSTSRSPKVEENALRNIVYDVPGSNFPLQLTLSPPMPSFAPPIINSPGTNSLAEISAARYGR